MTDSQNSDGAVAHASTSTSVMTSDKQSLLDMLVIWRDCGPPADAEATSAGFAFGAESPLKFIPPLVGSSYTAAPLISTGPSGNACPSLTCTSNDGDVARYAWLL